MKLATKKPAVKKTTMNEATNDTAKRVAAIEQKIKDTEGCISSMQDDLRRYRKERLELLLDPFKLGETVIAEVPCGKTRKEAECVLEQEDGNLYIRPFKNDGTLSERRFTVCLIAGETWADHFRNK